MKVILFNINAYSRHLVDAMTDIELNEAMLEDGANVFAYDDIKSFEADLNDGLVDVQNNWIKFVND